MVMETRKVKMEEEDSIELDNREQQQQSKKLDLKSTKSLPFSLTSKALGKTIRPSDDDDEDDEDDDSFDKFQDEIEAVKASLRKSPSVPVRTARRQFSLGEEVSPTFRRIVRESQGSMSGGRRKKASTSSVVSSASIDFSPFINLMGKISTDTLSSSAGSLRRSNSVGTEHFELQQVREQQETHLLTPGVTTKPPKLGLLSPRAGRRHKKKSSKEEVAATRRRKMRRRQAKLEKSGSKVFENYQIAISERRRSGDANISSGASGASSPNSEDDEDSEDASPKLTVPDIVVATISSGDEGETAVSATVREEDEATRERRRQSMARRRSWGDFGTAQREEDSNGGQLEDTRGVQSLDTDPKQQEQQQQHRQQHLNPHQHAFSRGSRLRSTWTFGNKKLNQQDSVGGVSSGGGEETEEEKKRKRDKLRQGFSMIGKMLSTKAR